MKPSPLYLLLAVAFFLGACDCTYDYSYVVVNETDSGITVSFTQASRKGEVNVGPGMSETLFTLDHGIEDCDGPHMRDVDKDFDQIEITQNDTLSSAKVYMDDAHWNFDNGVYTATVTPAEFQ